MCSSDLPTAMPVLATVGGLIIGSFLNVVIWRYPIMLRTRHFTVKLRHLLAQHDGVTPNHHIQKTADNQSSDGSQDGHRRGVLLKNIKKHG